MKAKLEKAINKKYISQRSSEMSKYKIPYFINQLICHENLHIKETVKRK